MSASDALGVTSTTGDDILREELLLAQYFLLNSLLHLVRIENKLLLLLILFNDGLLDLDLDPSGVHLTYKLWLLRLQVKG